MKPLILTLFLLVSLLGRGATRTALYETGFEAPEFDSQLPADGQAGWRVSGGPEALSIATNHAHAGQQALRIEGALLEQTGPNSSEAYYSTTVVANQTATNAAPIVELTASVRLDGPQTGTNGLPENDLMSANFLAVGLTSDGRFENLGQLLLSSAGRIFTTGSRPEDRYRYSAPLSFGTYHQLTLRVDFIARTINYMVDGTPLGAAPFASSIQSERIGTGALVMVGPLTPFSTPYDYDPANYTAYFDDYRLESVPAAGPSLLVEASAGERLSNGTSTVDFGTALVGITVPLGFVLRNVGDADLTGIKLRVDGPNAGDFSVDVLPPASISPGGRASFTVNFKPAAEGTRSATLRIGSNDPDDNPFTVALTGRGPSPAEIVQQAYIKASNTATFDFFGTSIAISGDTMVVGAPNEDSNATGVNGNQGNNSASDSGAAYIFVRNGTNWVQQAYLKASNTEPINPPSFNVFRWDFFGSSVAISGDTVVIGAPAEGSNATGVNGDQSDNSSSWAGAAYVFVREGTNWTQQAYLKASNTRGSAPEQNELGDAFGTSVAVSGDTIVVGAPGEDSNATGVNGDQSDASAQNSGAVYVFMRNGTTWTQQAYLKASNTQTGDSFGGSTAISGDTIVVVAWNEDSKATDVNGNQTDNSFPGAGAAYVFVRDGTNWTQQAYLKASNTGAEDYFGSSVSVSGDTVVVGAGNESSNATGVNGNQANNSAARAGAAYVFARKGTNWTQEAYLKASNTGAEDYFGSSVSVSGDTLVVGAGNESSNATGVNGNEANNSAAGAGAAYVFVREGTTWTQHAYLKASNTGGPSSPGRPNGDQFGNTVAVSGDKVAIGAWEEDSNAKGVNGNQNDNSARESGAAYVFTIASQSQPPVPPRILSPTRDLAGDHPLAGRGNPRSKLHAPVLGRPDPVDGLDHSTCYRQPDRVYRHTGAFPHKASV
jgi:hypothetical protein